MCCDQCSSAAHQFFDRFHNRRFGGWVEGRSRFIEQEDGSTYQKRSRDSNALPLTNAQMSAPFADEAAVSLRHLADKLIGLRPTRRFDDFFFGRIRPAIGNIFANCSREQQCVLQHDCDLRPQSFLCDLANIAAIKCERASRRSATTRSETMQTARARSAGASQTIAWSR